MELNEKSTMTCSFIEGAKFDLITFKTEFDDCVEHAIHQAKAVCQSIKCGPHPVFVNEQYKDGLKKGLGSIF